MVSRKYESNAALSERATSLSGALDGNTRGHRGAGFLICDQ